MSLKRNAITFAILTASFSSHAALQSFDSRSHAMGGTGVSSADYLTAPFHNPALGARFNESDDVGILIPSIGAQVSDQNEMIDGLEDFTDAFENFDPSSQQAVADSLSNLKGDKAHVEAGLGFAVAIPNQYVSVNIFAKSYADAVIIADVKESDITGIENGTITDSDTLASQGVTMGAVITDIGVSLSKSFDVSYGTWYVGVTPKYQMVNTINYVVNINDYDFDNWDDDKYQNDEGNMNVDFGMAFELPQGFVFGFSGRNLIENTYETELVDVVNGSAVSGEYTVSPVYTVGASFNHSLVTIAADIDLNENERYESISGLSAENYNADSDNTQMAGIGAEFNAWNWAQVRLGYQHDIAGNQEDQVTAGLGFSPFGAVHVDLSASYAGDNQFGAVAQTYFTF